MYLFNITSLVSHPIVDEWLQWQRETNIPEMMETGCFTMHRFSELLHQDETEGKTFVLQLMAGSIEDYHRFLDQYDESFRERAVQKWGDGFISFRTLLKHI